MKISTTAIVVVGAALVVALGVLLFLDSREVEHGSPPIKPLSGQVPVDARPVVPSSTGKQPFSERILRPEQKSTDVRPPTAGAPSSEFTLDEQKTVDAIQDALDGNDYAKVRAQLKDAAASTNAMVRARAVEALQWFGEKALPELMPFLADPDDDVKSQAETAVEQGLAQMEDDKVKIRHIESIISIKGVCTKDSLTMITGQLKGISDETLTVAAARRIIEANRNPDAVQAMKEVYEFATGEAYTSAEAADAWIKNKQAEAAEDALVEE